jgi:hypothetical protein
MKRASEIALLAALALALGACGGGGDSPSPPPPTHAITGNVSGATDVKLELSGVSTTAATTTDGSGNYRFAGLADGTYTIVPSKLGHALWPARLAVTVSGADAIGPNFSALALASYDPLSADTLDSVRWQTPEYVHTISGGVAALSVRASGMQSNLTQGLSYTSNLVVSSTGGGRVTSLQADVSVPSAGANRSGAAANVGGIRLYFQPSANRGKAFPGAYLNQLIVALEVYDGGAGPQIRRRFAHCNDAACVTLGGTGIAVSDPGGFTLSGVSATAPAAYDTTYTFGVSLNEATGVFTWTVQGGSFGAGVSGTADISTWAASVGMTLASTTNGFQSAQLHARTSDASAAGGGSGAITATFDNVMVGTNGAAATLYDDFSSVGSGEATGFSQQRWGSGANAAVSPAGAAVHLTSGVTTSGTTGASQWTQLAAMYPVPVQFKTWQADVALVADTPGGDGAVQVGGAFLNDGSGGFTNDGTGDVVSNVFVRAGGANLVISRCLDATCSAVATISQQALTPSAGHPLGVGTVHTVFQQWDEGTRSFTCRLDDADVVQVVLSSATVAAPWVPSRYVRATIGIPPGPAGRSASVEATVANVRAGP